MELTILANETLKQEILRKGLGMGIVVNWMNEITQLKDHTSSDLYIDMDFETTDKDLRISSLISTGKPVIINAVSTTLSSIGKPRHFIRINGWPGFISREIVEIAAAEPHHAEKIFQSLGWKYIITPDIIGFYTARVIAAIINEAYYTFDDSVSSKEEIDIAMKLGTNYPYGPFEWARLIGIEKIRSLLYTLSKEDARYTLAPSLLKEPDPS
jgi:3-hydroxybutyryl-CoA dehydrogenase